MESTQTQRGVAAYHQGAGIEVGVAQVGVVAGQGQAGAAGLGQATAAGDTAQGQGIAAGQVQGAGEADGVANARPAVLVSSVVPLAVLKVPVPSALALPSTRRPALSKVPPR
jgi:hypothetical protein